MGQLKVENQEDQELIDQLNNLPFFEKFDDSEKQEFVSSKNYIVKLDPGTTIISQGSIDYSLYFLLEGEVNVTKNNFPKLVVATLGPGAIFGEIAIISHSPRRSNIIAKGGVKLLRLNGQLFEKYSPTTQNKLNKQVIKILVNRLESNNASLIKLKAELDSIGQVGALFKSNFDEIIKKSVDSSEMFDSINETIVKLIR